MSLKTLTATAALAAAILLPALPAQTQAASATAELYWGATLLDPATKRATPDAWIVVDGGRIVRTGRGKPPKDIPAARRHDFRGHFLLPGLFDTHAHVALGPVGVKVAEGKPRLEVAYDPAIVAHNGRMLLAYGVTTIRDTGEDTVHGTAYARDERAGRVLGPEALMAGDIIDRSPMDFAGLLANLPGAGPIDAIVRRQKEAGVDYIKLYAHLTEDDLVQGIAAARANGLKSIGHLETVSWTRAAELGIDSLTHMMPTHPDLLSPEQRATYQPRGGAFTFFEWFEAVDLDGPEIAQMIQTLKAKIVHVDATLIVFYLNFFGDQPAIRDADLALAPPALVANWKAGFRFDAGWKPEDYRRAQAAWPKVLKLTRMLHDAGVPMTLGTDMANPFTAPGVSLSREMELHVQAGIPAWNVLAMATTDAARILGMGQRTGRIATGFEADAVFLKADPRKDMAAMRQVAAVLNDGQLLDPEALKRGGQSVPDRPISIRAASPIQGIAARL